MKRWHLLHVDNVRWGHSPDLHEIQLDLKPSPDMMAFAASGLLVLRAVGGIESEPEVYGLDPMSGEILWRFSETDEDVLFFSCQVEYDRRIVATTRHGVYILERSGPRQVFAGKLHPSSVARLSPKAARGYVLDDKNRLVVFGVETGEVEWTRKPPKSIKFGHPFPLDDERVCLSTGLELLCLRAEDGAREWRYTSSANAADPLRHAIEHVVQPDLLLVRSVSSSNVSHATLQADTGTFLHEIGDVWAYGADGITKHPVVLFEGKHESIAFLKRDGSRTKHENIRRWFGGFRSLPEGCVALYYDSFLRYVVATNHEGKVAWRQAFPGSHMTQATMFFGQDTAYFATADRHLHIWDFGE